MIQSPVVVSKARSRVESIIKTVLIVMENITSFSKKSVEELSAYLSDNMIPDATCTLFNG